jgi:hypothetical protein
VSDQVLLITWIIGFVVTAWGTARYLWREGTYERDPFLIDYLGPFLVGLLWPIVLAVGAVAGLIWLFIQSAKPDRIRLPKRKRHSLDEWERVALEARIAELETELGLRSDA